MTPDQADTLRDAINQCRHTSRQLMLAVAEGREVATAILNDDAAAAHVNRIITELTNQDTHA